MHFRGEIEVKLIMKFLYRGYVLLFNPGSDQIVNLSFALKNNLKNNFVYRMKTCTDRK